MAIDVFISYAREDIDFVRTLHRAIDDAGRQAWVDWEGIPPTAEWMNEIESAIEAAHVFIFVISPDSMSSEICMRELAHGVENNKRLIPLVRHEVTDQRVASELSQLNWIFFRDQDDFDTSFQTLITAIDTDYDWVKTHTRLLVRAKEWINAELDNSLLMRGDDLRSAEAWLATSVQKDPTPTGLHSQFILASRKQTTKRLTTTLAAVATALVVAIILAVVATYQKRVAEQRRQVSLARQLTTQAVSLRSSQLDVSLLLSLEAGRIIEQLKKSANNYISVSDNAIKGALLDGLTASPRLVKYLRGHNTSITSVAYSPDGKTLASADNDGTIMFWDMDSMQAVGSSLSKMGTRITKVTYSPAGDVLAAAVCKAPHPKYGGVCRAEVQLLDPTTGELLGTPLVGHRWNVTDLVFSSDGRHLASAGGWRDNSIVIWDLASRTPIGDPLVHSKKVTSIEFTRDNKTIASSGLDGKVLLWDVQTQTALLLDQKDVPVWSVAFSPDGQLLAGADSSGAITLWSMATRSMVDDSLLGHKGEARDLVFHPDGKSLISVGRDNVVVHWDKPDQRPKATPQLGHTQDIYSVDMTPDGKYLASAGIGGELIIWRTDKGHPLGTSLDGHNASVEALEFDKTSDLLASADADGTVLLWNTSKHPPHHTELAGHEGSVFDIAFDTQDTRLVSVGAAGLGTVWDLQTQDVIREIATPDNDVATSATIGHGGEVVAYATKTNGIRILNPRSREYLSPALTGHSSDIESLGFNPDNHYLVSAGKGEIKLWDLKGSSPVKSIVPRFGGSIFDLEFTPTGDTFVSAMVGGLQFWDTLTGEPVGAILHQHGILVSRVAFVPDGGWFASGTRFKRGNIQPTVQLWDLDTHQPFGTPFAMHSKSIKSLAFSPNGKKLASGGEDNKIVLWDVDYESWKRRACEMVGRTLTAEEWKYFLDDEPQPIRDTCTRIIESP